MGSRGKHGPAPKGDRQVPGMTVYKQQLPKIKTYFCKTAIVAQFQLRQAWIGHWQGSAQVWLEESNTKRRGEMGRR